ncbi:DNA mismatch repair protein Msh6-like [Asterias rubens]|uniref:DNA mismatch repair protein Msh6-like n=1 Tax=Asterias rubens TaxID=7604 RepID=UPI001454F651|nr:DNA mismatch repair protein Msh6-like [Asterias rubens]
MPKNTLFSYFSKSPAVARKSTSPLTADDVGNEKSKSPKEAAKGPDQSVKGNGADDCAFKVGDVVWAKLEGYPWWPSLVCNHPTLNTHIKQGKKRQVHVQFFDESHSRSWIFEKYVETLKLKDSERGGKFHTQKLDVCQAVKEAKGALDLSVEDRLQLIMCTQSDEEQEEQEMKVNGSSADKSSSSDEDDMEEEEEEIREKSKKMLRASTRQTPLSTASRKRRRIIESSDDDESSGDEYKPHVGDSGSSDSDSSGVDENETSEASLMSESGTPQKSRKRKRGSSSRTSVTSGNKVTRPVFSVMTPDPPKPKMVAHDPKMVASEPKMVAPVTPQPKKTFLTPTMSAKTKSRLTSFQTPESSPSPSTPLDSDETRYPHQRYEWLKDGHRRDLKGNPQSHPDYDPRTLFVPKSFQEKTTPAMRQWWAMKSRFFDTVLFFKMGKFYEFYHMDAEVGVKELGLIYMKGENAHSGFPEIAYGRYSDTLIQKGYRVARVEQTETPDMVQERCKKMSKMATKYDKVVKREICRISTKGTRTYSFIDGDTCEAQHSYLLAVKEKVSDDTTEGERLYGVCFVDTSIGKFHLGQFTDDRHCSRFRTLIAHYNPAQVLFERSKLSPKTQQILSNNLLSVIKEPLVPGTEFWDSSKTLKILSENRYFEDDDGKKSKEDENKGGMPSVLQNMISDADTLGHSAKDSSELAVSALGACTWYLKKSCLEHELLSLCNFELYVPLDVESVVKADVVNFAAGRQHMVLDGVTLYNLDILENGTSGTLEGTLLERLDQCCTPFGKRLFKQWLCAPLCNPKSINDRLDAVEDLINIPDKMAEVNDLLRQLPDLERLLSKIHTLGLARSNLDHPDSRAIFFEDTLYSKRKIQDFLTALDGFKTSIKIIHIFKNSTSNFKSKLLKKTLTIVDGDVGSVQGRFPDLTKHLSFFDNAFDHRKAKEAGAIVPNKGVDPEYDGAIAAMKSANQRLDDYLDKQRKRLGCKTITYWGTGKNRFQLEVPESALSRHTPEDYELQSSKKGFKRYWTIEIQEMFADLVSEEERRSVALRDSMRRVFHAFDEHYKDWDQVIQCLSVLDVLQSLSYVSQASDGPMCRPQIISPTHNMQPFITIQNGRHPCISRTFTGGDFIPNDTYIGTTDDNAMETNADPAETDKSCCVLVTGPNMGGKSTLMRQVGLMVIMAQLGCFVPADQCRLTPVDRVFTRLGARDNILSGESTFFVELSETASILQHATRHSLVLMDELGRGTATYDGTAIASAVVMELSGRIKCRTLFSTHYHSLVEEYGHDANIQLGHMACMVENENEEDPSQETITFLYKFAAGACPKSYGFNAAKLANLPDEVVKVARKKAHDFEMSADRLKAFRTLHRMSPTPDLRNNMRNLQQMIQA